MSFYGDEYEPLRGSIDKKKIRSSYLIFYEKPGAALGLIYDFNNGQINAVVEYRALHSYMHFY